MLNIYIAASGGNGYILTTEIISDAFLNAGYDVKAYIQEGLIQRNGIAFAGVRIGKGVLAGEIPVGCADIMLGLEPLEAYRKSYYVKGNGTIILSDFRVNPAKVIYQVEAYPNNIKELLDKKYNVIPVKTGCVLAEILSEECDTNYNIRTSSEFIPRKMMVVNTYCIGVLANILHNMIGYEHWTNAINLLIPHNVIEENLVAFNKGYYK